MMVKRVPHVDSVLMRSSKTRLFIYGCEPVFFEMSHAARIMMPTNPDEYLDWTLARPAGKGTTSTKCTDLTRESGRQRRNWACGNVIVGVDGSIVRT